MFKALKGAWADAKKRVEEDDKARAAAQAADATSGIAPDKVPVIASQFASTMSGRGLPMDFSPASVAIVDRLLAAARTELAKLPEGERKKQEGYACLNMGAYVGEILRREEGGVWTNKDGLPAVDLGEHVAPVVGAALALFVNGQVGVPAGPVDSLASYYQAVSQASRAWLESVVRGNHESLASLQREMTDDPDLAPWLLDQAQRAVKTATTKWSARLDFTPRSLDAVEQVLGQLHDLLKTAPASDRPTDKQIENTAVIWGVYVGEVVRRHYGGKWAIGTPERVLQLEINEAKVFPVRKVQKRLLDGPGDAIPFYFHAMRTALAPKQ